MNNIGKVMSMFAAGVTLMSLAACDNEDYTSSPDRPNYAVNYVYLYEPVQAYSTIDFKATGDFISQIENPLALTPVRCTKPAPEDITVHVAIDESYVAKYNEANKTDYGFLTGVKLTENVYRIKKGEYLSTEEITMDVIDREALKTSGRDLLLPIAITSVSEGGVKSEHSVVYIRFIYKANFVSVSDKVVYLLSLDQSEWADQLSNMVINNVFVAKWNTDSRFTFTAEIDENLVGTFNQKYGNGFEYKFMTGASIKGTPEIEAGSAWGSLAINPGTTDGMAEGDRYVIPVKITAVSGTGAALSEDPSVCYIVVYMTPPSLKIGNPAGSIIDYNSSLGWTFTVNGSAGEDDFEWTEIFGSSGNYLYQGDVVNIDLARVYKLTGIWMEFYAWYYAMNGFESFMTSADGNKWTDWEASFSWGYVDSNSFAFAMPTDVRYIRFVVGPPSYSSYYGTFITGLKFYEE